MISPVKRLKPVMTAFVVSTMLLSNVQASPYQCVALFNSIKDLKKSIEDKKQERLEQGLTPEPDIFNARLLEHMTADYYKTMDSVTDYTTRKKLQEYDSNVKYHTDANEAFASIINAIENAKYTLDLSYYIFARDGIGFTILQKVKEAHKRGVQIRIMVDALGSGHLFHGELKALHTEKGGQMIDIDGKPMFDHNGQPMLATVEVKVFQPIISVPAHLRSWMALTMKALNGIPTVVLDKVNQIMNTNVDVEGFRERYITWSKKHTAWQNVNSGRDRRSHDKILGVDLQHPNVARFFTGGRNMATPYFGIPKVDNNTFHDLSVEIRPLKDQLHHIGLDVLDYYNKLYFHLANKNLSTWLFAMKLALYNKNLTKMNQTASTIFAPETAVSKAYANLSKPNEEGVLGFSDGFKLASVRLVDDIENISRKDAVFSPIEKRNRRNADSMTDDIYKAVQTAKKDIKIISPYLFLYPKQLKILQEWAAQDSSRRVTIFGNSVYSADNMMDQALTDHIVGPSLMAGFPYEAYGTKRATGTQFEAPKQWRDGWKNNGQIRMLAMGSAPEAGTILAKIGKLHEKVYIFDDQDVIAGTSNQDPRSMYLNAESGVHIRDKFNNGVHDAVLADAKKLFAGATLYGSVEWEAVRNNEINKMKRIQCDFFWHIVSKWKIWGYL